MELHLIGSRHTNGAMFTLEDTESRRRDWNLQQADGKPFVDLRGQPDPEVGVDLVGVDDRLHQLVAEGQRQVAVLKETILVRRNFVRR